MPNAMTLQVLSSLVLFALGVAFLNPFHLWMTTMTHMVILGFLVAAFGVFAALLLREQAGDERETTHRMLAGRGAFLVGATILLVGIVWQAYTGSVDTWLVLALCGMVLAKTAIRFYGDRRM
ncbi:MAG: hypothetical protein AB202_00955 [Parcubacteria bacterium C7867-007]|nr:MAG: hypothetical protein AB202_00955 [Parcubacteria bacterium C7867-007]